MYYQDQLCYYKNILYRAIEDFESEVDFNPIHWVKLASLNSEDIKFNNLTSAMFKTIKNNESENIKLSELRDTLLPKLMNGEIDLDNIKI